MESSNPSVKGRALQEVVARVTTCQQSLQRQGMNLGSVSKKGNAFWGVLRLINEQGPLTVPQIALQRKVSRQRIQVMMDDYVAQGYLEFKMNPSHKRSQLVDITQKGKDEFNSLSAIIFNVVEQAAHGFNQEDLQTTARVLEKLQDMLDEAQS